MSFNYEQIRKKEEEGHTNWWTSYADLFMMLSVVFLLMYVSASLRSGAAGYLKELESQRIAKENADLREQIKVYTTLKDQQLQEKSEAEQQVYAKLMDKLKLLKEEAKEEKEELQQQAKENEEKEFALNQYQQVIRNIIDANILAKAQIQRREQIIHTKDQTLTEKEKVISAQEQEIHEKERLIASNEVKIKEINQKLKNRIELLRREQKRAHTSRKEMEKRIARLRSKSAAQISSLNAKSVEAQQQLSQVRSALEETSEKLEGTAAKLEGAQAKLEGTQAKLQGLTAKVSEADVKLAQAEKEKGRFVAAVEGLKKEKAAIQSDLEKTRALANARKDLAGSIGRAFKKAGISADVDGKTGVVTLDFGEEYFDTGRVDLKPEMKRKIDQFFPIYTDSLFNNPKTADKIANVEIIGFASSTYKGKYVNPTSLKSQDQEAVTYNLKLSFSRANEIFKHIYGKGSLSDDQKKKLLPVIKVVGRGYLPEGKGGETVPSGMDESKFCSVYNCKKAQKVIVRFNLKD